MSETKKTQPTPGPWKAEAVNISNPNGFPFWHIKRDDGDPHSDSIVQIFWHGGIQPQDEANAHLIAAAPDFYDAATAMIERHDEKARRANFDCCGCDDCTPFRAAIARAKGESK